MIAFGKDVFGQSGADLVLPHPSLFDLKLSGKNSIAMNKATMAYIDSNDTLWVVGSNNSGMLGDKSAFSKHLIPFALAENVISVWIDTDILIYLTADRKLYGLGKDYPGQFGLANRPIKDIPTLIAENVSKADLGNNHLLFTKTGSLWGCGANGYGQLGTGDNQNRFEPVLIASGYIRDFSAGGDISVFVNSDNELWGFGANFSGELGVSTRNIIEPIKIASEVTQVLASDRHIVWLNKSGQALGLGSNQSGQLGGKMATKYQTPKVIMEHVFAVAAVSSSNTALIDDSSRLLYNHDDGDFFYFLNAQGSVSLGSDELAFITQDHRLNLYQLRQANFFYSWALYAAGYPWRPYKPHPIRENIIDIAAGSDHSLLLDNNRSLWGSGRNREGQLGTGSPEISEHPHLIAEKVQQIATGNLSSFYIQATDNPTELNTYGNGYPMRGSLLNDDGANAFTPSPIGFRLQSIAAGSGHILALDEDGNLFSIGYNNKGQLGSDSTSRSWVDEWEMIDTEVKAIWAHSASSLYLRNDDTLWGMGYNQYLQIPAGGNIIPTPRLIAENVLTADVGNAHIIYIDTQHRVWARGLLPDETDDGVAFKVFDQAQLISTDAIQVATGDYHSMILKDDGTLWTFGYNLFGQLGDGTLEDQATPVKVAEGVFKIAAGDNHSLALTHTPPPLAEAQFEFPLSTTLSAEEYLDIPMTIGDEQWIVTGNQSWLTVSPNHGFGDRSLTFTASANDSGEIRHATIYVNQTPLDIWQSPASYITTSLDKSELFLSPSNPQFRIDVESDGKWPLLTPTDWLSFETTSGTGNEQVELKVAPFNEAGVRTGYIIVGADIIPVTQHGSLSPIIETVNESENIQTTIAFPTYSGFVYQLDRSPNLAEWEPYGEPIEGDDETHQIIIDPSEQIQQLFQLKVEGTTTNN